MVKNKIYSAEDIAEVQAAVTRQRMAGRPEIGLQITQMMERGEEIPQALLSGSRVNPEKEVARVEFLEQPPRYGKGSGFKRWREFAKETTDIEPEIIDSINKKGALIELLEQRGVIPTVDMDDGGEDVVGSDEGSGGSDNYDDDDDDYDDDDD